MNLQGVIGKKSYQSQGFLQDGTRIPLSAVLVGENLVSQVKTADKDGYNAIQIAFDTKKRTTKALEGHIKKAGLNKTARFFREIRVDDVSGVELGSKIDVNSVFKPGDLVNVTGVSKGKGWAGVVKRWHFKGGPRTHGQSDRERAPGSIGQTTTPGRVYKGKKMGGKMGNATATAKNLEIIDVTNDGVILIKGLIPGHINGLVMIRKVGENKKFVPLYREVKEEEKEEAQKEESASRLSVSSDVQESGESSDSNSPSLNDSSAPETTKNQEISVEPAVDSAEDGQAPIAQSKGQEDEVKEDAK